MNNDLNRRIAEALGQRVVMRAADDDLWVQVGAGAVEAYVPLPNYTGDLNAAWALLQDLLSADYVLMVDSRLSNIAIHDYMGPNDVIAPKRWTEGIEPNSGNIAAMICEAWLAWKDQHAESVTE